MKKTYDQQFKIVLVGSSGVGKSSLLIRFVDDEFKGDLLATIGVDFRFRTLELDGKKIKLQIWDTAGQDTFRTIISAYYKGADSIVILFDLNEPSTFNDVQENWRFEIEENKEEYCKLMLIGNKSDMESDRRPTKEQIEELKSQLKTELYFETSAKDGSDVVKAFTELTKVLVQNRPGKSKKGESVQINQHKPKGTDEKKKCCG